MTNKVKIKLAECIVVVIFAWLWIFTTFYSRRGSYFWSLDFTLLLSILLNYFVCCLL